MAALLWVGWGVLSDLKLFWKIKVSNPGVVDSLSAITTGALLLCKRSPPVILRPELPAGTLNEPSPNSRCGIASSNALISPIVIAINLSYPSIGFLIIHISRINPS